MSQKLKIKLTIAGRSYPLSIEREKEERYRRAEKSINSLVSRFESNYRLEPIDHLAMTSLQLAVTHIESEMSKSMENERDELIKLDRELDQYLNSFE